MDTETFANMVAAAEREAGRDRRAFKIRTLLLGAAGYGYIFLVLGGVVAGMAALVWLQGSHARAGVIKLMIPLAALLWAILRSLWISFPPPEGRRLKREEFPRLFTEIDSLASELGSPRPSQVLLDGSFNAAALQRPRLGPFGWYEHSVILGLPLMETLPADEFRAVIAHELGHLSGAHGKAGAWIYRIRETFVRLTHSLEESRSLGSHFFKGFLAYWWPRFNARAFVVSRMQELYADADAARLFGAETLGRALARLEAMGRHLESQFWPALFRRSETEPVPPNGTFAELAECAWRGPEESERQRFLAEALHRETGFVDTHPSLDERLRAVGAMRVRAALPSAAGRSAAQECFGAALAGVRREIEEAWRAHIAESWKEAHETAPKKRARLAELEAAATEDELFEKAMLVDDLEGTAAALPQLESVLAVNPNHEAALFLSGRALAERSDPQALERLHSCAEKHSASRSTCLALIDDLEQRLGRHDDARRTRRRAWAAADLDEAAGAERAGIRDDDPLAPHGLSPQELEPWIQVACSRPEVEAAWLARKRLTHHPEHPLYLLLVRIRVPWYRETQAKARQFVEQPLETPGECFVIVQNVANKAFRDRLVALPGSRLF